MSKASDYLRPMGGTHISFADCTSPYAHMEVSHVYDGGSCHQCPILVLSGVLFVLNFYQDIR